MRSEGAAMTVKELIAELQKITVPAEVYFPNMEIDQLESIQTVRVRDKGPSTWVKPEYRYEVILR
jgi:hypothetical protein